MVTEGGNIYSDVELTETNKAFSNSKDLPTVESEKPGSRGSDGKPYSDLRNRDRRRVSAVAGDHLEGDLYDERFKPTQRGLKSRHAQMIAIGGTMGTGLFVSTGETLARGGPAFILVSFCLMSFLIWCMITLMVEVAVHLPTQGCSMNFFAYRYVSRTLGFAMGWLYWYSLGILVPYEITAAGLVIGYWQPPVNIGVWITISASCQFLLAYSIINHILCSGHCDHRFKSISSKILWRN